jgi:phospholipid transport system substrate-binding protein
MVAETTAPLVKVETTVNKVIYLLKELNPEMSETDRVNKLEQIKKAIENSFSFEQIARRSLGRNWNKLDENQQKTFMELFSKMLLTTYLKNFKGVGDAGITFEEERKLSENKVEIYSKVTVESTEFPVIYRMVLTNNEWEVYDAIVEGISLVSNYRSQFDSILNRQSPEKLLEILKEKVDSTSDQE